MLLTRKSGGRPFCVDYLKYASAPQHVARLQVARNIDIRNIRAAVPGLFYHNYHTVRYVVRIDSKQ
jgi:hypothetical protein